MSKPASFSVVFAVPASASHPAFESRQNIWACSKVVTPEDAIREAYARKRRPYQCRNREGLDFYGRVEPISGCTSQVILHPNFDLQVVRVVPNASGYCDGGMSLFDYTGDNAAEFTRESVPFRIRREQFDAHCYDETGARREAPCAMAA